LALTRNSGKKHRLSQFNKILNGIKMTKINYGIITGLAVQLIVFIWFFSAQNHKIEILYDKFEKENEADVIENQVKMKLDLENLMQDVKQIKKDLRQGNKKDKEIMDQHQQLFNLLNSSTDMMQQSETKGSSYSYGD